MTENNSINWIIDKYSNLTLEKLYNILWLRAQVFVLEQDCPYLDPDNKDQKAVHIQGYLKGKLVAYCRLFDKGDYFENASIGRVVVNQDYRRYGFGDLLMITAIENQFKIFKQTTITISAQLYLKKFYEKHGFKSISETYLEDGIPHIRMQRN